MKKILFLSGLMITVISFGICFAEAPTSEMLSSMSDEELKALSTQLASSSSIYSFFHFVGDLFGAIFVFGALLLIPAWFFGKGKLIATLTAISFCMGLLFGLGNSLTMPEGLPEVNAEIEQRKKNISAEATKQQQKEKAEKTQTSRDHQTESINKQPMINEETITNYTINRTVQQFDEKYKDEEHLLNSFKIKRNGVNKYGNIMIRSVSDDDGTLLYEYENRNGQIYLALLVYKQSNKLEWGNAHLRYFTYAVQPSLGPVEIRRMMAELMSEDTVEKDDIKYHSFNNDKNGDKIFAAANKKLFPKRISSMQEIIDKLK